MSLLRVENLRTHLFTDAGRVRAVDGVTFGVDRGEALGILGETGAGKTMLALSILGLQPGGPEALQPGSSIRLQGEELVGMPFRRLRSLRGREMAMVFQEPLGSLNPVLSVEKQLAESIRLHRGIRGRQGVRQEACRLLELVRMPEPGAVLRAFPHHLSGGMAQRVMVAMALAGGPSLLVADEPTTALDVTTEARILKLLADLQSELAMGLILISHDVAVLSALCTRLVVLYGGKVVESGSTAEVMADPRHPYTRGLLGAHPTTLAAEARLSPVPGEVPDAAAWPEGCRFRPRCPLAFEACTEEPSLFRQALEGGEQGGRSAEGAPSTRAVRCWLAREGSPPPERRP